MDKEIKNELITKSEKNLEKCLQRLDELVKECRQIMKWAIDAEAQALLKNEAQARDDQELAEYLFRLSEKEEEAKAVAGKRSAEFWQIVAAAAARKEMEEMIQRMHAGKGLCAGVADALEEINAKDRAGGSGGGGDSGGVDQSLDLPKPKRRPDAEDSGPSFS